MKINNKSTLAHVLFCFRKTAINRFAVYNIERKQSKETSFITKLILKNTANSPCFLMISYSIPNKMFGSISNFS